MAAERFVGSALQLAAAGAGETYSLLGEAAFAAITRGDDAQARQFADRMEMYSATAVERAAAQEMRVFARRASGDLDAALAVAREVLAKSGVKLPLRVTPASLAQAVLRVFMRNPRKAERPLDPAALALEAPLMRTINGMGSLLFERDPLMAVLLATSTLGPRIIYGTAAGAGTYSLMCCAFGDYRRAAAWAAASDRLQGPDQPLRAVAKQYSASFGHVFVRPRPLTRSRGDEMLALAYAGGDLAVAAYGNRDKVLDALFSDDPLAKTTELADEAIRVAERLGDAPTILHVRALRQCLEQLRCGDADGWRLDGAHFDLVALRARLQAEGLANAARAIAALEALLGVLFGCYSEVALFAERPWPRFAGAPFQAQTQLWTFATGLALYRTGKRPSRLALWNLRRLAQLNPNDFRHRERLLAAERARTAGRRRLAMKAYAEAVDAAALSRCLLEYGLVAAAAAEGAAALGAHSETGRWREVAINAWRELGAEALLAVRFGTAGSHVGEGHKAEGDEGQAAAERASRAKSRLLATVGHELRTPLQGAMGLVELAETGDEAVDLPSLRRVIHHLAGVVGDLTDLGALDGDVIAVRPEPVEVVDLIASVVALHRGEARAAGRSVLFDPPDAAMWVRLDARRLRQVVGNLLTNALRHGEGVVRVSLTSPAAGRLTVSVADEGPSIGAAERLRIFEPFDRGGRDADDGGLGVGLFLGRRLARAMGGDLTVRSLPLGKAFELETEAPAADIPVAEIAGGMAGLSVLLAEDTELSRQVLAALLRREGCRVVEAADGSEALAALAGRRFDLLLLDQRMPGASGLEVAAACAADDGPRPRIVLMTASGEDDLPALATQAGVDLLLQKPVSIADLRRAARVAGSGPIGRLRIEELWAGLGPEADALLGQLRPTMEIELARLEAAVADGHSAEAAAQLHRLRGLAAHFGLDALAAVIPDGETADAGLANRLRTAAGRIDWSVLSRPR
jgi:signal transduction histidine kinase/CheY-like chemotaxis protein